MTRDEAIEKVLESFELTPAFNDYGGKWVAALTALGILKLDEPKSVYARFHEALCTLPLECRLSGNIEDAIARAGLKIVPK